MRLQMHPNIHIYLVLCRGRTTCMSGGTKFSKYSIKYIYFIYLSPKFRNLSLQILKNVPPNSLSHQTLTRLFFFLSNSLSQTSLYLSKTRKVLPLAVICCVHSCHLCLATCSSSEQSLAVQCSPQFSTNNCAGCSSLCLISRFL
jgi:hypothetical protein